MFILTDRRTNMTKEHMEQNKIKLTHIYIANIRSMAVFQMLNVILLRAAPSGIHYVDD